MNPPETSAVVDWFVTVALALFIVMLAAVTVLVVAMVVQVIRVTRREARAALLRGAEDGRAGRPPLRRVKPGSDR